MAAALVNLPMRDIALWTSEVLDITAFAVILIAVAISTAAFVVRVAQSGFLANYRDYRANLGRGILTIAGERMSDLPTEDDGKTAVHINERFGGRFRRVVSLSDDIDPNSVSADYRDGVLHISAKRRESAKPRRIAVQ